MDTPAPEFPDDPIHRMELRILTITELCQVLGIYIHRSPCPRTIRRWCGQGLPHRPHPITGRLQFRLRDVLDWLVGEPVRRFERPIPRASGTSVRHRYRKPRQVDPNTHHDAGE